jgi:hypothetical protein
MEFLPVEMNAIHRLNMVKEKVRQMGRRSYVWLGSLETKQSIATLIRISGSPVEWTSDNQSSAVSLSPGLKSSLYIFLHNVRSLGKHMSCLPVIYFFCFFWQAWFLAVLHALMCEKNNLRAHPCQFAMFFCNSGTFGSSGPFCCVTVGSRGLQYCTLGFEVSLLKRGCTIINWDRSARIA